MRSSPGSLAVGGPCARPHTCGSPVWMNILIVAACREGVKGRAHRPPFRHRPLPLYLLKPRAERTRTPDFGGASTMSFAAHITSVLKETRTFAPSPEFSAEAHIKS